MQKRLLNFNYIHKKTAISLILAVFLVFIDIFLKNISTNLNVPYLRVIGDFFRFTYAENTGIAFSIPVPILALNIVIGTTIFLLFFYYLKEIQKKQDKYVLPLTFIIVGAIINFTDRLRFGYVIDYFDLKWFTVFNVADCMIVLGAGFFIYRQITEKKGCK